MFAQRICRLFNIRSYINFAIFYMVAVHRQRRRRCSSRSVGPFFALFGTRYGGRSIKPPNYVPVGPPAPRPSRLAGAGAAAVVRSVGRSTLHAFMLAGPVELCRQLMGRTTTASGPKRCVRSIPCTCLLFVHPCHREICHEFRVQSGRYVVKSRTTDALVERSRSFRSIRSIKIRLTSQ